MNKKIVCIGVNHAGTSAIKTLLIENPKNQVIGFEANDNISFLGCGIALAIGGVVKNTKSLFYATPDELRKLGATIKMNHKVSEINFDKKYVIVEDLITHQKFQETFDVLVYAAGSWPYIMPFHKPEYKGVKLCKNYAQALSLIEDAKKDNVQKVAILGAGYIGVELTEAFAKTISHHKEVTLVDMEDRIMPRYFGKHFTNVIQSEMKKSKVNLLMEHKVVELVVDHNNNVKALKAENIKTKQVTEVGVDLVISCVGFAPQTKMLLNTLPNLALSRNKAVQVNQYAQALDTDGNVVKDLYVIGDSASQHYYPSNSHENVSLATNAVKLGVVAASHINYSQGPAFDVFKNVKIQGITGTNAISVFDYSFASTGVSKETAHLLNIEADSVFHEGNDRCEFMGENHYGKVMIELIWEKGTMRLIGAQIGSLSKFSHTETIYMLSLAIQKQLTLFDLLTVDVYFLPHLNKPLNFVLCAVVKALGLSFNDHCYLCN